MVQTIRLGERLVGVVDEDRASVFEVDILYESDDERVHLVFDVDVPDTGEVQLTDISNEADEYIDGDRIDKVIDLTVTERVPLLRYTKPELDVPK